MFIPLKGLYRCLYRVSTDQQVDYDKSHTADISMQRIVCHRFAEEHGWEIVKEVQEEGVSGHKVRAANRDGIQKIKEAAINSEFDILLVFMFDRLGVALIRGLNNPPGFEQSARYFYMGKYAF